MKKVALISFIKSYNYGASLQAFALWYVISHKTSFEGECTYIDYKRNYKLDLFIWLFRKIRSKIIRLDDMPSYTIAEIIHETLFAKKTKNSFSDILEKKFRAFWDLIPYTNQMDKKHLKSLNQYFDTFIVGSDQVWNSGKVNIDTSFLLDFVEDEHEKYSYASSFGMPGIPLKYESVYKKYLSRFTSISLREKASIEMVENLLGKKEGIYCHCDPTILINKRLWDEISKGAMPKEKKYVLVYDLTCEDNICMRIADIKAKEMGIDVCFVSQRYGYGPLEWLQLFLQADFIVTNSFHGTAFSINFEKEFISLIPSVDIFEKSKDRIQSLLNETGIQGRIIEERDLVNCREDELCGRLRKLNKIDYNDVMEKVEHMRLRGIKYLEECLK